MDTGGDLQALAPATVNISAQTTCLDARYSSRTCCSSENALYIHLLTLCLWFVIEFVCVLRSRDGKYTGKKIFDGSSVYMRASVRKWLVGGKELFSAVKSLLFK